MYSELWINRYGEDYIYNYLKNKNNVKITSHNEDDARLSFAIENYLVKYKNSSDKVINHFIDSLFEAFSSNPLFYSYSYILSNDLIVKSLINNNEKRKKLYNAGLNKLINGWENTYNKLMNNEQVNINDKNKLIVLFTRGVRNHNKVNKHYIDNYVNKLLNENKIPDNDFEKLLLFNYASRYTLGRKYNMVDTFIKLSNLETPKGFRGGYQNNGFIVLNDHASSEPFYQTLDEMIQCACHETTHTIQEQQAINEPDNVHAMEMAIQRIFAFNEYLTGENYLFNEIEEDAQRNGYYSADMLYRIAGNNNIANGLIDKKNEYVKNRKFQYEYITYYENGQRKVISKEKYNVENIRKIVKEHPELINKFPVLTNLFDILGNHKSLENMLKEEFKSHDIRDMYTDFIIYDIRHNGLNNIDLNNKTSKEKYNILKNLCKTLRIFANRAESIIRDEDYRKDNDKKTAFSYNQALKDVVKLSEYIEKELPWMRHYEKIHMGDYSLYSTYTSTMRTLLNVIDEFKYKNKLTNLEKINDFYKDKLNQFDLNMKKEYMNFILDYFTINERSTLLKINNQYMSLEKFVRTELMNHMSRDHYLYDNSGKLILNKNNRGAIRPNVFARLVLEKYKVFELDDMFENTNIIENTPKKYI